MTVLQCHPLDMGARNSFHAHLFHSAAVLSAWRAQPIRTTRGSSGPRETNSGKSVGCKIPARISRLSTMRGPGRAKYALAFTTYTRPLYAAGIEPKSGNRLS